MLEKLVPASVLGGIHVQHRAAQVPKINTVSTNLIFIQIYSVFPSFKLWSLVIANDE